MRVFLAWLFAKVLSLIDQRHGNINPTFAARDRELDMGWFF